MQTGTSKPCVTCETIKYLFGRLFARYGAKWSSQYPADMMPVVQEEWLNVLQGLTPKEFRDGLDNWAEDWPPNAQEFFNACRPPKEDSVPYHKMLEAPKVEKASKQCGLNHLEACRAILGSASVDEDDTQDCAKVVYGEEWFQENAERIYGSVCVKSDV